MIHLDTNFWKNRYETNKTGWDLGFISNPLKSYFDQLTDKKTRILIPGGGNSYEAEYLFRKGFTNVFVVDLVAHPLENIKKRVTDFPKEQLLQSNFFDLQDTFDLMIEQTFFCAINPNLRANYAKKASELLIEGGKLVGLLFDAVLNTDHPPFGGGKEEYLQYFKPYFDIQIMDNCYNSSGKRQGMELFMKLQKLGK